MDDGRRYAIYYTATGPLAAFGAAWLGWNIATGRALPVRRARIEALTRTARRYGFHATLKAPFRLAAGSSEARLAADLRTLAASLPAVALTGGLRLGAPQGFPALVPVADSPALTALAARLVRDLDHHRAPLSAADRARRRPDRLNAAQTALLDRWGYPWVMEEFRFHLTLGDRLPPDQAEAVLAALAPHLGPLLSDPLPIDAVTLAGEDAAGRFRQILRLPLAVA